ncbi:MAG: CsbD family protein [Acidiferrobacteraceae bacterium]
MNREHMQGKWMQIKGEAKKKWGKLTDDDLTQIHGDYDKLVGKIHERHGDSEEQVRSWIDKLQV